MRRFAMVALLLVVGACSRSRVPVPVPAGWKRVTIDQTFTVDVPQWMKMKGEVPRMPIDSQMTSDPVASGGMEGPERIFHWSRWAGPIHSYYSEEVAGRARKSPVWWIVRTSSSAVNWPGFQFTNADSIQYTFVIVADGRRTVEAMLLEPVPADTATTRKILGSVRILSDGE